MEIINELEVRNALKSGLSTDELTTSIIKHILNEEMPWEDKRPFWHLLYLTGREATLAHAMAQCLKAKMRIPFDLLIQITSKSSTKPLPIVVKALLKGVRKQDAAEELIGPTGWDRYDKSFAEQRETLLNAKIAIMDAFKSGLLEKFEFLQNQRMNEQAGRVLRRMVELYPGEEKFAQLKRDFDEQWARDVLSDHQAERNHENFEQTVTAPSTSDEEMLKCFVQEGEKIAVLNREAASDLSLCFLFMDEPARALEMMAWAPPSLANDWLRAELMFASRHFIEALELLNQLEIKYIKDPESTFAVSYLRAQCLRASGQEAPAMEILRSILRVRPGYRSTSALLQEWSEGASWE